MVSLRFITNGNPRSHKLVVAETGEEIRNIRRVTLEAVAGQLAKMEIEVINVDFNATALEAKASVLTNILKIDEGIEVNNA